MAYLRVYLNNALLDQFELTDDTLTIGRARDNDIVLDNPGVSSHHAVVKAKGIGHVLIDQDSTNGTFINNKRIKERELAFRDEIQIYNFVLKYMPRARLAATEEQEAGTTPVEHAATVEIAISDVNALKKLRKRKKLGQLIHLDQGRQTDRHVLRDIHCSLGRARDADIRIGGWFAPKTAAIIVRQHNAYHLIPQKRGKVKINGLPVTTESVLKPGDHISIRGKDYLFQYTSDHGN